MQVETHGIIRCMQLEQKPPLFVSAPQNQEWNCYAACAGAGDSGAMMRFGPRQSQHLQHQFLRKLPENRIFRRFTGVDAALGNCHALNPPTRRAHKTLLAGAFGNGGCSSTRSQRSDETRAYRYSRSFTSSSSPTLQQYARWTRDLLPKAYRFVTYCVKHDRILRLLTQSEMPTV